MADLQQPGSHGAKPAPFTSPAPFTGTELALLGGDGAEKSLLGRAPLLDSSLGSSPPRQPRQNHLFPRAKPSPSAGTGLSEHFGEAATSAAKFSACSPSRRLRKKQQGTSRNISFLPNPWLRLIILPPSREMSGKR